MSFTNRFYETRDHDASDKECSGENKFMLIMEIIGITVDAGAVQSLSLEGWKAICVRQILRNAISEAAA
jgi:hypothetical protein